MSLLDTASLIVTPNGYKAGTLYSVIPNTTLGDLSVTRATTATRVNSSGLIESVASNVPRLDYTNGSCPSILVEPQRTNLWIGSEVFSGGSQSLVTYTANTTDTLSPSGNNTVDKFAVTTSGGDAHTRIPKTISVQNFSLSIYVKGNAGQKLQLFLARDGYTELKEQYYTLNGNWQRVVLSDSFSTTSSSVVIGIEFGFNASDSVAGQVYYLWGAQLEAGSYATSYIPTTSASVTRNADVISKTGISSLIGQTEGTVFFDIRLDTISAQTNDPVLWYMKDGGTGERYVELFDNGNLKYIEFNGAVIANITKSGLTVGRHKCAIAYANNDMTFYVDGVQIGTGTSGTPSGFSEFGLQYYSTEFYGQQKVNAIALWKTRLTNTQMQTLTSL
jgi:hypothetical protein